MIDDETTIAEMLAQQLPEQLPEEAKIPFETRRFDIGEWVYDHRRGIYATIIFYLLIAIWFTSAKISIEAKRNDSVIAIDLQQLSELERVIEELKKSIEQNMQESIAEDIDITNAISNEAASQSETSEDQSIEDLLNDAIAKQEHMEANRKAYEEGLAQIEQMRNQPPPPPTTEEQPPRAQEESFTLGKREGNVTVSYILINPIRHAQRLVVPAYTCKGGGEVSINIIVNQSGEVVSAKVASGGDECMQESALSSALHSRFDINKRAPARQSGIINYLFVAQ